jgi:hypothetical protein
MHIYMAVAGALITVLMAAGGIAALTTGWVMPWRRSRVLRPRLWGFGWLICAVGWGLFMFLGPFVGPPAGLRGVVAWCGWAAFMAGLGVQVLSQRPGRTPGPSPTKTSA